LANPRFRCTAKNNGRRLGAGAALGLQRREFATRIRGSCTARFFAALDPVGEQLERTSYRHINKQMTPTTVSSPHFIIPLLENLAAATRSRTRELRRRSWEIAYED
jgi:hypothetical protein